MATEKFVRKLQRTSTDSYTLNIPKEIIDEFGWKEHQKIEITFGGRKHDLLLKDWRK